MISRATVALLLATLGAGALALPTAPAHAVQQHAATLPIYWATVDNLYPYRSAHRTVTVSGYFATAGQPLANVRMATVWRDGKHTAFCYGTTGADGYATCTRAIGAIPYGATEQITVTFTHAGQQYSTGIGVLPQ